MGGTESDRHKEGNLKKKKKREAEEEKETRREMKADIFLPSLTAGNTADHN